MQVLNKQNLIDFIEALKNNSEIKSTVDKRILEFKSVGSDSTERLFSELAFCILTANFNAEKSIVMQNEIANGFSTLSEKKLAENLRKLGHRYPEARANYVVLARKHEHDIKRIVEDFGNDEKGLRVWLDNNIKGVGYKLASHFLRNIGFKNLAIIDFHIIDILVKHATIERPKTLTPKRYLEIEEVLRQLAAETNLTLAELDLYLWYMETGKILK